MLLVSEERFSLVTFDDHLSQVLRALCINPNGLFWAGDTAQTIAAGSSFRFDDLKAFLFRIEVCLRLGDLRLYSQYRSMRDKRSS